MPFGDVKRSLQSSLRAIIVIAVIFFLLALGRVEALLPTSIALSRRLAAHSRISLSSMSTAARMSNPDRVVHVPREYLPENMRPERTKVLVNGSPLSSSNSNDSNTTTSKCVYYWMQRDVRTRDNWALSLAAHVAEQLQQPLRVIYALAPPAVATSSEAAAAANEDSSLPPPLPSPLVDLPWTRRHTDFVLGGLECVSKSLAKRNIPLHVVLADSHASVGETVFENVLSQPNQEASLVVCDFSPLRQYRERLERQLAPLLSSATLGITIPLWQVDAHNIVPVWTAAPSRQVGARTLRPKIHNVYKQYMRDFPKELKSFQLKNQDAIASLSTFDRDVYERHLQLDASVPSVAWMVPGTKAAGVQLQAFIDKGLAKFDTLRNDPTLPNICSNLSPWINHGHVSFQRVAYEVQQLNKHANGTASFIEEGVIRRELSDNYVYYTPHAYDSLHGAAEWAQQSLQLHASDPREPAYSLAQLETAQTYDDLWNAAQLQLVREGRMHGFLRMYWAKKVLEWTAEGPATALAWAQYLNDKYALDGRDPNGFVGVGWSIMGVHDMGWKERPIFGKIRYMNYAGCKRKFKVDAFVARYKGAAENAEKAAVTNPTVSGGKSDSKRPAKKQKTLDMFTKSTKK